MAVPWRAIVKQYSAHSLFHVYSRVVRVCVPQRASKMLKQLEAFHDITFKQNPHGQDIVSQTLLIARFQF